MSLFVVNEHAPYVRGGMVHVDADLFDLDRRIKEGDESGWRGDPSMGIYWNPETMMFDVVGVDRTGQQYLAASHHKLDHTLITKLIAGDPRKHNVPQEILARNAKRRAEQEATEREQRLEIADKMHFALKQDLGHHMGGRHRQYAVSAPSSKLSDKAAS